MVTCIVSDLQNIIAKANDYILLDPNGNDEGKYLRRWCVRLNVNIDELKESVWA